MKKQLIIAGTIALIAAGPVLAGETDQSDKYRSSELSVDLIGTGSIGQQTIDNLTGARIRHDIRLGAGVGLNYYVSRNVGFGFDAYSESLSSKFVDNASGSLLLRLPIGQSGFAPYLLGGVGRQFDPAERWFGQVGGGLEYRFDRKVGLFADVRYVHVEAGGNHGLGRAGLRITF